MNQPSNEAMTLKVIAHIHTAFPTKFGIPRQSGLVDSLRGEVGEITQQLDIMPTLLGLTGNREPYFAFGRDVLNEPQRPRWSVSYDGRFRALTGEGAIVLDDSDMNVQECPATPAADSLAQNFRALVQQYYTHIEKKNYTAND